MVSAKREAGVVRHNERPQSSYEESMAVTRDELYEQVWAEPMTTVAGRYHVSSSFMARVCARLNVPRPPRGYWAKRKVGLSVKQSALPEARSGG